MGETLEFENDRVRVLRVKHAGRERHPQTSKRDRLIIYLNDGHVARTENGKKEESRRKAGRGIEVFTLVLSGGSVELVERACRGSL